MGEILLGTSGWDYPEWVGRVYPPRGAEDKLRYYAGRFPIVEVNSTFYRLPSVNVAASWAVSISVTAPGGSCPSVPTTSG